MTLEGLRVELAGLEEEHAAEFTCHNVLITWFQKVNSPTKSSTYYLTLLIKTIC